MAKEKREAWQRSSLRLSVGTTRSTPMVILDKETYDIVENYRKRHFMKSFSNAGRILIHKGIAHNT